MDPPKDLPALYLHVEAVSRSLLSKIRTAERKYYGWGKPMGKTIKKWASHFKEVKDYFNANELRSAPQGLRLVNFLANPASKSPLSLVSVKMLKDFIDKTRKLINTMLQPIIDELTAAFELMKKYCLSFFAEPKEDDGHNLDFPRDYEKRRSFYLVSIESVLVQLDVLNKRFSDASVGLTMTDFTAETNQLADRLEVEKIPIIFVFNENVVLIRSVTRTLADWIQADGLFAELVEHEVESMAAKKLEQTRITYRICDEFQQLEFRKKQLDQLVEEQEKEMSGLELKEEELSVREEMDYRECRDRQIELEIREFQREEVRKKLQQQRDTDTVVYFESLNKEIRDLKERIPSLRRKLSNSRVKLGWIHAKRDELDKNRAELTEVRAAWCSAKEAYEREQDVLVKLEIAFCSLREISNCKRLPETLTKIYYSLPVALVREKKHYEERLKVAFHVVARNVGRDWMALYRSLPFVPQRGVDVIEKDILDLEDLFRRGDVLKEVTLFALKKWARLHTRPTESDLISALRSINRDDIAQDVDSRLNPSKGDDEGDHVNPIQREIENLHEKVTIFYGKLNAGAFEPEKMLNDIINRRKRAEMTQQSLRVRGLEDLIASVESS